jgi:putative SOS response-associated peptidase YedK
MPLILREDDEKLWLNPEADKEDILSLVKPLADDALSAHTISKLITDKKLNSNTEDVYKPYEYPELQLLDM